MAEFRTLELAKSYYALGKSANLNGTLRDQFLRSASSVALNAAEGNAKSSLKDRLRIFEIARGSFLESQTILSLEGEALRWLPSPALNMQTVIEAEIGTWARSRQKWLLKFL